VSDQDPGYLAGPSDASKMDRSRPPRPAGSYSMEDATDALRKYVGDNTERYPTGYSVDDTCGRQGAGELALLLARASIGKSNYVLNVIANSPWVPTLFVSLEMPAYTLCQWLVCIANELDTPQDRVEDVLRGGPKLTGTPSYRVRCWTCRHGSPGSISGSRPGPPALWNYSGM
jgi:hypothetical protein